MTEKSPVDEARSAWWNDGGFVHATLTGAAITEIIEEIMPTMVPAEGSRVYR